MTSLYQEPDVAHLRNEIRRLNRKLKRLEVQQRTALRAACAALPEVAVYHCSDAAHGRPADRRLQWPRWRLVRWSAGSIWLTGCRTVKDVVRFNRRTGREHAGRSWYHKTIGDLDAVERLISQHKPQQEVA